MSYAMTWVLVTNCVLSLCMVMTAVLSGLNILLKDRLEQDFTDAQIISRNKLKTALRRIVWTTAAIGIIAAVVSVIGSYYRERRAEAARLAADSNQTNLIEKVDVLTTTNAHLNSEVVKLTKTSEDLLDALLGCTSDLPTKSRIIEVKRKHALSNPDTEDLSSLASSLKAQAATQRAEARIQKSRALQEQREKEKALFLPSIQLWTHAIETLVKMLTNIAEKGNIRILSDYTNFPSTDDLCPSVPQPESDYSIPVAEMTTSNSAWICKCSVWRHQSAFGNPAQPPDLQIKCSGKNIDTFASIRILDGKLFTGLMDHGEVIISKESPFSKGTETLEKLLKDKAIDELVSEKPLKDLLKSLVALQLQELMENAPTEPAKPATALDASSPANAN